MDLAEELRGMHSSGMRTTSAHTSLVIFTLLPFPSLFR